MTSMLTRPKIQPAPDAAPVFAVPEDLFLDEAKASAVKKRLLDAGVKYCYASYVDVHGVPKAKCTPMAAFEKMCKGSELFTVGAMEGMGLVGPQEDECAAVPDLDTCTILPWDRTQAMFFGELYYHGEPYANDSRVILKRALAEAKKLGYTFNLGCEPEFYFLKIDPATGKPRRLTASEYKGVCPAYDVNLTGESMSFLDPMVRYLEELGYNVYSFDQEGGRGQYEFDFKYADALTMADRIVMLRLMGKKVAEQIGAIASFMPKPFATDFRSGCHFNMSLADVETGANLFAYDPHEKNPFAERHGIRLSKLAYHFAAGLLKHAKALTAVTCPTYNSYQGLIAQGAMADISWAPVLVAYGKNNRSAMVRLPLNRYCVENRAPDMSCNPYLAAAFTIAAGLDGVKNELDPGEPLNENCYSMTIKQLKAAGVELLPRTLLHALEAFDEDPLAEQFFGGFKEIYLKQKMREWEQGFYEIHEKQLTDRLTFI